MRLAKRLAFLYFDNSSGIIKGEQPLIRASRASKVAGAFLVLFWHAKENLALPQQRFNPRHKRANSPNETTPQQQKLYFFVSDFIKPPSAMIFWMKGGKGSA